MNHDLPDVFLTLKVLVRVERVVKAKHVVDERLDFVGIEGSG